MNNTMRTNRKVMYMGENSGQLVSLTSYTCIGAKFIPRDGYMVAEGYTMFLLSDVEKSGRIHRVNAQNFVTVGHDEHTAGKFDSGCPCCFAEAHLANEILTDDIPTYR
jgi:hypothetical protein